MGNQARALTFLRLFSCLSNLFSYSYVMECMGD